MRHPVAGVVGHDLDEVPPYVGRTLLERLPEAQVQLLRSV
jgi:hypothetical protein